MKVKHIFLYIILIAVTSGYGQSQISQVVNASGGTSLNKAYSLEWSIGELTLINELDAPDSSYILTNGFIQPTDGLVQPPLQQPPVLFNTIELSTADVHIFPNPTQDILEIHFLQNIAGKIVVQLYNELGHMVYKHEIFSHGSGLIEKINMKGFTNGIYILNIKRLSPISDQYDLETTSFKIIKL
jgi:hypothetical protein